MASTPVATGDSVVPPDFDFTPQGDQMTSRFSKLLTSLLAAAGALLVAPALAATLYGTTGAGGDPSILVQLDPATGALISTIGPVGYQVNGMASGRDGTLYAVTRAADPACPRGLISINTTTGAGTPIGCGASGSGDRPVLLTADASGQLYGWWDPSADDLITWNKVTGTYSAPISVAIGTGSHTLAFDVPGTTLYLLQGSTLYTVNPTTGSFTDLGTVTGSSGEGHHGDFNPDTGRLYAINGTNVPSPGLVVIDVASRTQIASLPTVPYLHTLAFFGPPAPVVVQEVPVDNPWALAAVALLLAAFGAAYMRRQA